MSKPGITPPAGRKPQTRKISIRSTAHHLAGPEQSYPTYNFGQRVFAERPKHNPFLDLGIFTDDFQRAGPTLGSDWVTPSNFYYPLEIVDNLLVPSRSNGYSGAFVTGDAVDLDTGHYAELEVGPSYDSDGAQTMLGLLIRGDVDSETWYAFEFYAFDFGYGNGITKWVYAYKIRNGSYLTWSPWANYLSGLYDFNDVPQPPPGSGDEGEWSPGDRIRVSMVGKRITASVNGRYAWSLDDDDYRFVDPTEGLFGPPSDFSPPLTGVRSGVLLYKSGAQPLAQAGISRFETGPAKSVPGPDGNQLRISPL